MNKNERAEFMLGKWPAFSNGVALTYTDLAYTSIPVAQMTGVLGR